MCTLPLQSGPPGMVRSLYVDAGNIEIMATYLDKTASINTKTRLIHFPSGDEDGEKLLEVPIGHICPNNIISVTVGLLKEWYEQEHDRDLTVGISDGAGHSNMFKIHDVNNYAKWTPCKVIDGEDDNKLVRETSPFSATVKLTFNPMMHYGVCETPQDYGYINTGTFNTKMDFTEPFYLRLNRDNSYEEYYLYYIKVEIYRWLCLFGPSV